MAVPQRLPIVGSDDGTWGDIIRQFLMKEHYNDDTDNAANGGHKNVTIRPGTSTAAPLTFSSGTNLTTPAAGAMEYDGSKLYFTPSSTRQTVATYNDASGATGDMYYRDSSGNFVRLGIGSSGQVLQVASGLPAWNSINTTPISTQTASYTLTVSDSIILADATSASLTITLPAASSFNGYRFTVKRIDNSANTVTLGRTGSDLIDGATSYTLDQQYISISVISNGSGWYIL
jgi:hypothetical protein